MRKKLPRAIALAAVTALVLPIYATPSGAAPENTASATGSVVINEIYVRGGNVDGKYRDFVELYNPSDKAVSLDGMSIQYFTKDKLTSSSQLALKGTIAPRGYFLVGGKPLSTTATESPLKFDVEGTFNASATAASLALVKGTSAVTLPDGDQSSSTDVVDIFGWGSTKTFEKTPQSAQTSGGDSYQRAKLGVDSNDNAADFVVQPATPQFSGGEAGSAGTTPAPDPSAPAKEVTIAEIQGSGPSTPLMGQIVKTKGIVTAVYPTGGFNGLYIQTPGTGGNNDDGISDGVFVYSPEMAKVAKIGEYYEVTGEATEYKELTQVKASAWTKINKSKDIVDPKPVTIDAAPAEEAKRESLEGMLISVTGIHTVTNNYDTNRYGQVGLAIGTEPIMQPTEFFNPNENPTGYQTLSDQNSRRKITLDDGSSWQYYGGKIANDLIPVPYLNVKDPIRVGAHVSFKKPMILDYRFQWNYQPTEPVNVQGADTPDSYVDNSQDWISITNNKRPVAPGDFGGDVTISSFNVLNYFISLGQDEDRCQGWPDRKGELVTTKRCSVRGAYSAAAMQRQQTKIVAAINKLDSTIIGLEEIENSAKYSKPRDTALSNLVQALNKAAGFNKWTFVPSPAKVPDSEDVIRLAYIYQAKHVKPLGESKILIGNEYISGYAREPLAQEWQGVNAKGEAFGESFVTVVNHLKSKGSLSTKIPNDSDKGQGNNNLLRVEQAKAMTAWVEQNFAHKPVFILGDMNSYTEEDPLRVIENKGYISIAKKYKVKNHSYQFSGIIGSLDHGFANAQAEKMLVGADVWNVNAMEPVAFEYSNYNMNVKVNDLYDTTPYRSSDHDPIKFALKLGRPGGVPGGNDADQCVQKIDRVDKVFANTRAIEAWSKNHPNHKFGMKKVKKNSKVAVRFCGFTPNTKAKLYFYTDAKLLGETVTTANGELAYDFAIPQGSEPGLHYVVAYSEADQSVAAMQVLVEAELAINSESTTTPGTDVSGVGVAGGNVGKGSVASTQGTNLANTGSQTLLIVLGGIATLLLGAGLVNGVGLARRKK
ncbi:ExeM/NucH family extracellular endonuclease [Arcanobacterium ihumii]|uniref:ExeM/NucH family extracellular endonuclease n=1 Tax=Arcanobacterium ihumii TaxID=2138162 RepID=UPI000F53C7EE|nr:ExeM/NucH family extracellular endonuclease [Arcanobacterium ihumii]